MNTLRTVQQQIQADLQNRTSLTPVELKHPLPSRPARMLGLIKLDGKVFSSQHFQRIVCLRISLPVYCTVFSTFIRPRLEYDLPVLSCEVICMGTSRIFVLDIHGVGINPVFDTRLLERLLAVRASYPGLIAHQSPKKNSMQSLQSAAACRLRISQNHDAQALSIVHDYLAAYLDHALSSKPLEQDALAKAQTDFKAYLATVIDHDPGVKGNSMFYGRKAGIERALDMFYGV